VAALSSNATGTLVLVSFQPLHLLVQVSGTANPIVVPPKSVAAMKHALKQSHSKPEHLHEAAVHAHAEGCKHHAAGRMIVAATLTGELCLFENVGASQWM
jgi:hypothetical protein